MPQITASTARRSIMRRVRSLAEEFCACANAEASISASAARIAFVMTASFRSKRIDVVEDRVLSQDHAPDDVRRLEMVGVDRGRSGAARRQPVGEFAVVEPDPHDEGDGLYILGHHGCA